MKKVMVFAVAIALAGMTGCASRHADVPTPTRFANENQQKLQSARHWQLIAEHFAGQVAESIGGKLNGRSLHVPQPGGEQAFVEGFREMLVTALVNRGIPVALTANGALVAEVRYQAYRFRPERVASTYYYGEATALTAGLWAVGSVLAADISPAVGVSAGVKALTAVRSIKGFAWLRNEALGGSQNASGSVPRSEIVLTVSIADQSRIISRQTTVYYSADEDADLYWKRTGGSSVVQVKG